MFKKEIINRGEVEIISVSNQGRSFSIEVVAASGAYVNSLVLNGMETIDGAADDEELSANPAFKSTLLAPFPNRIKDGKYSFNSVKYQLPINETPRNNALHGLVFKAPYYLSNETLSEDSAILELRHDYKGEIAGYPFKFTTIISYQLSAETGFSASMQFTNLESHPVPFGFGWHPYFRFSKPVDDLFLQTTSLKMYKVDNQMIPTGEIVDVNDYTSKKSLSGVELDDCFVISGTGGIVTTELSDNAGITLKLWQETGERKLNYLQIFTPPHRKSIAIEPQTCCIDAFNNKNGYFELKSGETISARFGVNLVSE